MNYIEVETTTKAEKTIVPSGSTEEEASLPKKRALEDSQKKRFTTAKDRREHLNKNF